MAAVERWGVDRALDACEGMFAAALWDRRDRELHLLRDRFGEKPLYYGWVGGVFAFGSELKALCTLPGFDAELDRRAVARFLRHNCIPAPDTIWRGVRKLLPGHLVTLTEPTRGVLPEQRCYWSAADAVAAGTTAPADRLGSRDDRSARGRIVRRGGSQDGCRRASGSIPLGGDRFEHHRGPDAAACLDTGSHLYCRIRRSFLRRVIRGGSGRRSTSGRTIRRSMSAMPRRSRSFPIWRTYGTSLSPMSPRSRPTWSAGWRAETSPCPCREMAATSCSLDTTATPGSTACGGGPPSCRPGPAGPPARRWARIPPVVIERAARATRILPARLAGAKPINQGGQAGPGPYRLGPRGRLSGPHHPLG